MARPSSTPGWVMLDRFVRRRDDDSFPAGEQTATASLTNSRGDPFEVCLLREAPPRPSTLCARWPDGPAEGEPLDPVAAHGGAVLLLMHYTVPVPDRGGLPFPMIDYFVYCPAGPSLRRLPPLGGTIDEVQARVGAEGLDVSKQMLRRMDSLDIGIIRRGPEDFAVAELQIDVTGATARPELRVINSSVYDRWVLKRPRVVPVHPSNDLDMDHILWYWDTDAVIPFVSYLCWVNYTCGVLLCNVFDRVPQLLFLELPVKQPGINRDEVGRGWLEAHHALGAADSGDVLKFARVLPQDVPSHNGIVVPAYHPYPNRFIVTIWSLRLAVGSSMVWHEDSVVTADQLRDLDAFDHLPREVLMYPTFSLDSPEVVTFVLKKDDGTYSSGEVWMVAINMKKKTVKSSLLYIKDYDDSSPEEIELFERKIRYFEPFLPVDLNVDSCKTSVHSEELKSGRGAPKRKYCHVDLIRREDLDALRLHLLR